MFSFSIRAPVYFKTYNLKVADGISERAIDDEAFSRSPLHLIIDSMKYRTVHLVGGRFVLCNYAFYEDFIIKKSGWIDRFAYARKI